MDWSIWGPNLLKGTWESIYMVGVATFFTVLFGLPLGVLLVITDRSGLRSSPVLNQILGTLVNVTRSLPFIILLVIVIPITRLIVGTSIGSTAAIVPLSLAAIPFFARVAETGLREVDKGLVEAAQAMGCSTWQIIVKVLLPEALPSLILGMALTIISLISYSAMAGAIGGGGLGDLAIRYGYQRYETQVMIATVVLLIIIVQGIQVVGNTLSQKIARR
jgi:D-methionine transport system permease protein